MKILFIAAEEKKLGVGYLSTYLKKHDHQVRLFFDPGFLNNSLAQNRWSRYFSKDHELSRLLAEYNPDLVACSAVSSDYQTVLRLARNVREWACHIPIIFGGVHATLVPERVLAEACVDMVCVGEGEEPLLELAYDLDHGGKRRDIENIWFKGKQGAITKNPLRPLHQDLERYGFPDDDLFYEQMPRSYQINPSVMASRGCPYSCSYCGNDSLKSLYKGLGKYVRIRSVDHVIRELVWRRDCHRANHFVFMDDVFAVKKEWLDEFARRFPKEVGGTYNCLAHVHSVDEYGLKVMKDSGCTFIDFGLQTGSEKLRREVLFRKETNERMIGVARSCKKIGLRFAVDHMLNLPGEQQEDILASAKLYNKIRPNLINVFGLVYFPKARITDIAFSKGMLKPENKSEVLKAIHEGSFAVHQSPWLTQGGVAQHGQYRRYAPLLISIPLLPAFFIRWILKNPDPWFLRFEKIPLPILAGIKMLANIKAGMGFILWSIVRNNLFYFVRLARFRSATSNKTRKEPPNKSGLQPGKGHTLEILVFNNGVPTEKGMSGSDRRAIHWSRLWRESGHLIDVVAPQYIKERYPWARRFYRSLPSGKSLHSLPLYLLRMLHGIFRILAVARCNYNIVYSSSDLIPDSVPALLLRLLNRQTQWVSGLHLLAELPVMDLSLKRIYYFVTQRIIMAAMKRWAALVCVSNPRDKERLVGKGFAESRVLVTYGSPEWDLADQYRESPKEFDLCFIARDHPQKGWEDMVLIWKQVVNKKPDASLQIIGDMATAKLERLFFEQGIPLSNPITFHGFVDGCEKYHLLAKSRALAFPSRHESFGMVAAEAHSLGVPVVAYDLDFFDIVYPVGMLRVPKGDTSAFADRVITLLDDPGLCGRAGQDALDHARETFSFGQSGQEILHCLELKGTGE